MLISLLIYTKVRFSPHNTVCIFRVLDGFIDPKGVSSPYSPISRIDYTHPQEKAEQVLEILVSTVSIPSYHIQIAAALPLTRICLLLLGDRPTSSVATQILALIGVSNTISPSFNRRFELISGWSVLKAILPHCWDPRVNQSSFDILLGRFDHIKKLPSHAPNTVVCPNIFPVILSALQTGLVSIADNCHVSGGLGSMLIFVLIPIFQPLIHIDPSAQLSWTTETESSMENLLEEIMDLHASSSTFRELFKSQQTTQLFVDTFKTFVDKLKAASGLNQQTRRILEKISHFVLALAFEPFTSGSQKNEVCHNSFRRKSVYRDLGQILDTIQSANTLLDPAAEKLLIDPSLVADTRSMRQRIASARFSIHVGERGVVKTMARMSEWRKTVQISEHKILRKMVLDL